MRRLILCFHYNKAKKPVNSFMKKRAKIAILLVQGSTLSTQDQTFLRAQKQEDIITWLKYFPELDLIADIESRLLKIHQQNHDEVENWIGFANQIDKLRDIYDGFVLVNDVETITYTATILSFLLINLGKPIVCTGNLSSTFVTESPTESLQQFEFLGVKANLINAVQVATMPHSDVSLMFGNQLVRANRAYRSPDQGFSVFTSFRLESIGKVDFGVRLSTSALAPNYSPKIEVSKEFDNKVEIIQIFPGKQSGLLDDAINSQAEAIIIKSFAQTVFDKPYLESLSSLANVKRVVFHNYLLSDKQKQELEKKNPNITIVNNMTLDSTIIKSMMGLVQTKDHEQFSAFLNTDLAGEIASANSKSNL